MMLRWMEVGHSSCSCSSNPFRTAIVSGRLRQSVRGTFVASATSRRNITHGIQPLQCTTDTWSADASNSSFDCRRSNTKACPLSSSTDSSSAAASITRRSHLHLGAMAAAAVLWNATAGRASADEASSSSEAAASLEAPSSSAAASAAGSSPSSDDPVTSDLSIQAYVQILMRARRQAFPLIAKSIAASDFRGLAEMVPKRPIDDIRQAAFYIPWALLKLDDYTSSVACRKAYIDVLTHIQDIEQIAVAASQQGATATQVQQAFLLLSATLDTYIATIPAKYVTGRGGAAAAGAPAPAPAAAPAAAAPAAAAPVAAAPAAAAPAGEAAASEAAPAPAEQPAAEPAAGLQE